MYDPGEDEWELYYLPDDFSQANNLAAEQPEKLAELVELFWREAERNNVLPLLGGFAAFFGILPPMPTETRFSFAGYVQNVHPTLTPKIMGDRTGLHPVVIIVAIFFWGSALNGIMGMILAIPLTAFLVVFWRLARERYIQEWV